MSCIEFLPAFVTIEGLDVTTFFLSSALCFVATIIAMSRHIPSVSSRILFSFYRGIVSIVAIFLLLFALSFVATILSLS